MTTCELHTCATLSQVAVCQNNHTTLRRFTRPSHFAGESRITNNFFVCGHRMQGKRHRVNASTPAHCSQLKLVRDCSPLRRKKRSERLHRLSSHLLACDSFLSDSCTSPSHVSCNARTCQFLHLKDPLMQSCANVLATFSMRFCENQ